VEPVKTYTRLKLDLSSRAARITLDRPEVRNAFDDRLIGELVDALHEVQETHEAAPDGGPRALILTGAGETFCAGADMNWMRRSAGYSHDENEADAMRMAGMLRALDELSIPTIGRVNGACLGGGMGLIACCDIVVSVDAAKFGFTEARLGIAPAVISAFVLPRIGASSARRYFLTAEIFGAVEAQEMGLVHQVVRAEDLDRAVEGFVAALSGNGPRAVSAAKQLIREAFGRPRKDVIENAVRVIAALRASPEGQEGLGAFLEKRSPSWKP
jgi:methylglutaconyl-CoA hydratase